jgi:hypothetical protein
MICGANATQEGFKKMALRSRLGTDSIGTIQFSSVAPLGIFF